MTPSGIEPATFQFLAQHLNHFKEITVLKSFIWAEYVLGSPAMIYGEEVSLRAGRSWNVSSIPGRAIHFSVFQNVQNA